jgi:hypothetical protein
VGPLTPHHPWQGILRISLGWRGLVGTIWAVVACCIAVLDTLLFCQHLASKKNSTIRIPYGTAPLDPWLRSRSGGSLPRRGSRASQTRTLCWHLYGLNLHQWVRERHRSALPIQTHDCYYTIVPLAGSLARAMDLFTHLCIQEPWLPWWLMYRWVNRSMAYDSLLAALMHVPPFCSLARGVLQQHPGGSFQPAHKACTRSLQHPAAR